MEVQIPLVLFTLFLCLTNGLILAQGVLLLKGKGTNRLHQVLAIASFASMVIGGIAVFFHLQHWERIFNGFGHITSGITHELIYVVVVAIVLIVLFLQLRKGAGNGTGAEAGDATAGDEVAVSKVFGPLLVVVAVVGIFVTAHSYDMYARPAWNNIFLYLYYLSSTLILGAAALWTIVAALKETDIVSLGAKTTLVAAAVSAVVVIAAVAYIAGMNVDVIDGITFYTYDPTHPAADPSASLAAPLSGSAAGLFWGGTVVLGCAVPAVLGVLAMKKNALAENAAVGAVAAVAALAGGIFYRVVLYVVGIASYVYFF